MTDPTPGNTGTDAQRRVAASLFLSIIESVGQNPSRAIMDHCDALVDVLSDLRCGVEAARILAIEGQNPEEAAQWRALKQDLDFGLSRGAGAFRTRAQIAAVTTDSHDLLVETTMHTFGDSDSARSLLARYQQLMPEDFTTNGKDGCAESVLEYFAWETANHVTHLAELSERFPAQLRNVARESLDWPVMWSRRGVVNDHSTYVERQLELGRDYPLNTEPSAHFHRNNALGRYLTDWVVRLHGFKMDLGHVMNTARKTGVANPEAIQRCWPIKTGESITGEMERVLGVIPKMPRLTRATSDRWAAKVIVPLIMLKDAGNDEASCAAPALKPIWKQKGVKSRATFKSRLLTKVRQSLKALARPA